VTGGSDGTCRMFSLQDGGVRNGVKKHSRAVTSTSSAGTRFMFDAPDTPPASSDRTCVTLVDSGLPPEFALITHLALSRPSRCAPFVVSVSACGFVDLYRPVTAPAVLPLASRPFQARTMRDCLCSCPRSQFSCCACVFVVDVTLSCPSRAHHSAAVPQHE
jgi:hypothetical protein